MASDEYENDLAEWVVDQCDTDPETNVDPHPKLFSDLEDDRPSEALFELWRKGVVDAEWDPEDEATRWWLTEFGVELNERGLVIHYVWALENDEQIQASFASMERIEP